MKRLLVIYNSNSSLFANVKRDVLDHLTDLKGYIIGKYEVTKTNIDDNINKLAKLLEEGDLVVSAGGDATGVITSNAILKSGKDVNLAVLPYGNFNDLSRTLGTNSFEDIISWVSDGTGGSPTARRRMSSTVREAAAAGPAQKYYPLEIIVDGQFYRYSTCYVTIGMMGAAVKLYDSPRLRKKLKTNFGRKVSSYTELASWYFKNRHKKVFLSEFKLNGQLQPKKTSDYIAFNGRYMARIMKSREDYSDPNTFRSKTDQLTSFWRLAKLMAKSIFHQIPGSKTIGDRLEFLKPATVELQAEGEHSIFRNIKTIEIRKSKKYLKVIKK